AQGGRRMTGDRSLGRLAGALYLVVVATGLFSLAYVPSRLSGHGDPAATVANLLAMETLFRAGIASFVLGQIAFLLVPLALYRLLHPVDRNLALLMVALAVASVPIALTSVTSRLDALSILTDPGLASMLTPGQTQVAVLRCLDAYGNGLLITSLFWGLWLLPFGGLVLKSRCVPRVLGAALVLGGLGYIVDVFATLVAPGFPDSGFSDYVLLPAAVGEIGTCLWLLLFGAKVPGFNRS
ncbi:MAG: DUF4386 domain-containing protein, partial [Achromobacter pestifer]